MNKTEKAVLQGIRESLNSVTGSEDGDNWEKWANRMRATLKTSIKILDNMLDIEEDDEELEEEKLTL